ncbi:hypothetical protein GCM10009531_45020 [Actinoplanes capillaceus]
MQATTTPPTCTATTAVRQVSDHDTAGVCGCTANAVTVGRLEASVCARLWKPAGWDTRGTDGAA